MPPSGKLAAPWSAAFTAAFTLGLAALLILKDPIWAPVLAESAERVSGSRKALDLSLRAVEQRHIESVLAQFGGNKRQTARALGLSRSTLDRKLSGH